MKPRQIRDISDTSWEEITSEAKRRGMKIGEYLVAAHRSLKASPAPTGKVQAVTPIAPRARKMFACKAQGCNFHTALERACPRHPQAGLKLVA